MEISIHFFRYGIALLILLCAPPSLLIWLLIHPFASLWRRLGIVRSYIFFLSLMIVLSGSIWQWRTRLLQIEYDMRAWLLVLSILLIGMACFLGIQRKRHFGWPMVIGFPELSGSDRSGVLVTEGIYSRVRNPRYIETVLAFLGFAFFANYFTVYLALAAGLPILHVVVLLEERELTQRFGETYLKYCRQVPRYIPNLFHEP